MKKRAIIVFCLLLGVSKAHGAWIFGGAAGAGGTSTGQDYSNSLSAPGLAIYGGGAFDWFQIKGEFMYAMNTGYTSNPSNSNSGTPTSLLLDGMIGISPWDFLTLDVGYGVAGVNYVSSYASNGTNYLDQKNLAAATMVVGADLWPISINNVQLGVIGRFFNFKATNYSESIAPNNGSPVTGSVNANTSTTGWFIMAGVLVTL